MDFYPAILNSSINEVLSEGMFYKLIKAVAMGPIFPNLITAQFRWSIKAASDI